MNYLLIIIPIALILFRFLTSRPDIRGAEVTELLRKGGTMIDVRSQSEHRNGHIKNSINIPLADILNGIKRNGIEKDTPIILYCASGARSASAKKFLKRAGYTAVHNGGSIHQLSKLS